VGCFRYPLVQRWSGDDVRNVSGRFTIPFALCFDFLLLLEFGRDLFTLRGLLFTGFRPFWLLFALPKHSELSSRYACELYG